MISLGDFCRPDLLYWGDGCISEIPPASISCFLPWAQALSTTAAFVFLYMYMFFIFILFHNLQGDFFPFLSFFIVVQIHLSPFPPHHSPPPTLDPFLISVPLISLQFLIPAPALTLVLFSYLYSQKNWRLLFGVPISSPLYKLAPSFPEASFPFHLELLLRWLANNSMQIRSVRVNLRGRWVGTEMGPLNGLRESLGDLCCRTSLDDREGKILDA